MSRLLCRRRAAVPVYHAESAGGRWRSGIATRSCGARGACDPARLGASTCSDLNTTFKTCDRSGNWPLAPRAAAAPWLVTGSGATYFAKKAVRETQDSGSQHEHTLLAHAAGAAAHRRQLLVLLPPPAARCAARTSAIARAARRASLVCTVAADRRAARCRLTTPRRASISAPAGRGAAPRSSCGPLQPRRRPRRLRLASSAKQGGGEGQLRPRATPTVHDPPSPSPSPRLSRRPSAAPVPPPPTHGCAAAAAQSAAGRGGCPRRLCGSRAGRAELGRGVGRPQAARAQRRHRQRPRHGHGPARRRLGRHGAAGRRRAVQETPQLGAGLPPSRCPPRPVRPTP